MAADHGILGPFNVVGTVSLSLMVLGAVVLAARHPRTAEFLTVPGWLTRVPVAIPAVVAVAGLAGLVYAYVALY